MTVKEKIYTKEVFVSDDGLREFVSKDDCEIYDKYCSKSVYDVLKDKITILGTNDEIEKIKHLLKANVSPFSSAAEFIMTEKLSEEEFNYINIALYTEDKKFFFPLEMKTITEPTYFCKHYSNNNIGHCYTLQWEKPISLSDVNKTITEMNRIAKKFEKGIDK